MIEIHPNLFVGHQGDYEYQVKGQDGWAVVHACKEPYHRDLLGYTGRGAPEDHPDYFFAERGDRLYLNLVDAPNPAYIPKEIIDKASAKWWSELNHKFPTVQIDQFVVMPNHVHGIIAIVGADLRVCPHDLPVCPDPDETGTHTDAGTHTGVPLPTYRRPTNHE